MFYSESILNRSVKSFLLPLSLLISGLQAGQLPALRAPAAAIPAIQELQQFEKAQPLPLPGLAGQVTISAAVGTLAGAAAFNWLTATPVLSFAGMTDFLMPKDIAYVGGGLVGLGTSAALLYKLRRLQAIAHQNAQNQNAAVQLAAGLTQAVEELQEARRGAAQALELQKTAIEALSQGQNNLEQQINLRSQETAQTLANLAALQEQRFAAAEQTRAADTQTLQQQAATNHQENQERFGGLQRQLDALPGTTVQAILAALEGQRLAQQQEQRQRALPAHEDAAAAAEVRPLPTREGLQLPTSYFFAVHPMQAFMRQQQPMADSPADSSQLKPADEVE
ncbi:hypothetical protein EBU95_10745 [bacterium]|nr:hypothetical protein [bacterium]